MHALHSTNVKLAKLRMMILASYVLHCSSEVHLIGENIYHRYNLISFTQNIIDITCILHQGFKRDSSIEH